MSWIYFAGFQPANPLKWSFTKGWRDTKSAAVEDGATIPAQEQCRNDGLRFGRTFQ
ncbi:hypothetical protein SBDP1_500014 [Syntrophobacter sp. SbD1]|nr:hypothetical protein SBDP1_500014 [Syntrophobacter sp. SbD1]